MAKELPYFKFEPSEWENGNIQMCSSTAKGLFIDVCSMYWSRLGELPYALALQKLCNGNEAFLNELKNNQIIDVKEDQIIIDFLDEQLNEFQETSEKRRKAANKRWSDASALQVQSKSNAIREEEIREDNIIVDNKEFDLFWNLYSKKTGKDKCIKKWNKLNEKEKSLIFESLPKYIQSKPEIQYRLNPLSYLNGKHWEDEIQDVEAQRDPSKMHWDLVPQSKPIGS